MPPTPAVPGIALGTTVVGLLLMWSGVINRGPVTVLQDVIQGRAPGSSGTPIGPALADTRTGLDDGKRGELGVDGPGRSGQFATSSAVETMMATAKAQLGKPYVWGAAGPNAFDCSGLVTYCLKAAGLDDRRRVTAQYLVWDGARTIPRNQCAYGDLVCWSGHIGLALSNSGMIHAPSAGRPVQEGRIWAVPPPVIRRILSPTGAPVGPPRTGSRGGGVGTAPGGGG